MSFSIGTVLGFCSLIVEQIMASFYAFIICFGIPIIPFSIKFLKNQIKNRIKRLIKYHKDKEINSNKIKRLDNFANKNVELLQEESLSEELPDKNNIVLLNQIPVMLNKMLQMLEDVPQDKYVYLSHKIIKIINKYKELTANNNLSDSQIVYSNRELINDIAELEMEIMNAKVRKREDNRDSEITYLESKAYEIEEKGRAYIKIKG